MNLQATAFFRDWLFAATAGVEYHNEYNAGAISC